ncbi:MAG: CC0125/CC1285 family lipoprotein [Caulobacter sp.]
MTFKSAALAVALVVTAGLSACATATPYQPNVRGQAVSGGFSETRLETDRFRINFAGNSLTSRETVERYLLYRAAELTVTQGGDWFSLVERQTDRKARTYVEPNPYGPFGPYSYWRPHWRYYGQSWGWRAWDPWYGDPFWADRVDVRTVERFEASAEILIGHGAKPVNDPRAFDARDVMANLGPAIVRPPAAQ